jgi:hypothetical protein
MADVINLDAHRKKRPLPSAQEVALFCTDEVMGNWERFAKTNKLNDFIVQSLGIYATPSTNYLANRDLVAELEDKVGLLPGVWAPGINGGEQLGWRACFRFGEVLVETPDMASELYARCCNLLIFLKVKREMMLQLRPPKD